MKILVTGGAGFIGSAFVRRTLENTQHEIVNVDNLTYAGNLESVRSVENEPRYRFVRADIADRDAMRSCLATHQPDAVLHLAAESHVDRSIDGPGAFIQTNIVGTYQLLEVTRAYWNDLSPDRKERFRFHHVSTDEVFGSLGSSGLFHEDSPYQPNSPYSASKAASDHLARAWHHTYGLPVITTNCSNNYGPYQFPEKLIPLMILNALDGKPLPVYGQGTNVRDWLFVDDHVDALLLALERGVVGASYNVGGRNERTNLEVVHTICDLLDEMRPDPRWQSRRQLIKHVADRPGHDQRYAIDASRLERELGWRAQENFVSGLRKTVHWYLEHASGWCQRVLDGTYRRERLGLSQ